jgi:phosphatidate cytidylyltransferase
VTESKAAPAQVAGQSSRNLLVRVAAALVLAPLAIAIAYAGGWLWTALVTLAAIGLYIEWLVIVGAARETRVVASGALALVTAGLCFVEGRIDAAFIVLSIGLVAVAALARARRGWVGGGFLYAAAAQAASVLLRLDSSNGFVALMFVLLIVWVTDIGGYFCRPGHWRTETLAANKPQEDVGRRDRRFCWEPARCRDLCGARFRQGRVARVVGRDPVDRYATRRSL